MNFNPFFQIQKCIKKQYFFKDYNFNYNDDCFYSQKFQPIFLYKNLRFPSFFILTLQGVILYFQKLLLNTHLLTIRITNVASTK